MIFYEAWEGKLETEIWVPFAVNLALNFSWLALIFKYKLLKLQPLLCVLMNVSLYFAAEGIKETHPMIYKLQYPYFGWICIALIGSIEFAI